MPQLLNYLIQALFSLNVFKVVLFVLFLNLNNFLNVPNIAHVLLLRGFFLFTFSRGQGKL